MMRKLGSLLLSMVLATVVFGAVLTGCQVEKVPKIGVAFGVGPAARWPQEIAYMEAHAQALGVELETRFNTDEAAKPLAEDCRELVDGGVDVLIIRPRDVYGMADVVDYAHANGVMVISYDSLIERAPVDLFTGYDGEHTGQRMGRYVTELAHSGDYILLWGDRNRNVDDMYRGVMKYLEPLGDEVNILLEAEIPGWSPEEAKKVVRAAIVDNGNQVDGILAFNDKLAGACIEVLEELGITEPVFVAGMDAELDALHRVVAGTQACTAYMDLKQLSLAAIDQAVRMARGEAADANAEIKGENAQVIPAYLLTRQLVTKENLDRVLIEGGIYTREEVYPPAE